MEKSSSFTSAFPTNSDNEARIDALHALGCPMWIGPTAPRVISSTSPSLTSSLPPTFTVHNLNFPFPHLTRAELVRTVPAKVIVPALFSPADDDGTHRFIFNLDEKGFSLGSAH